MELKVKIVNFISNKRTNIQQVMKRTPTLTIWMASFILMVIFAESLNAIFWMSFTAFAAMSIYIEKHSKRLENEEE